MPISGFMTPLQSTGTNMRESMFLSVVFGALSMYVLLNAV